MPRKSRLKCKLLDEEGLIVDFDAPNDSEGRIAFLHILMCSLETHGFKKKKESFDAMVKRNRREYQKMHSKWRPGGCIGKRKGDRV